MIDTFYRTLSIAVAAAPIEVKWLDLPGEEIPLNERNKLDWCTMIKSQPVVSTKEPDTRFFFKGSVPGFRK